MLIFIPTLARASKQTTWASLPPALRERTTLVVSEGDESYARTGLPTVVCPHRGIGRVRQWILDYCLAMGEPKVLMLDDDLVFAQRRPDNPALFRNADDNEILRAVNDVEVQLGAYAHMSIAPREGGNRRPEAYIVNTRMLRALAYRVDTLHEENIRFDQMEFMEDFYVSLSLLTRGYQSLTVNYMVQNQNGSNLPGGCSTTRTMERQAEAAVALNAAFPQFVSVVTKKTASAWQGQERKDVTVQWKRAYESATPRAPRPLD